MLSKIWHYLFPRRMPRQYLPLLPLRYTSEDCPFPEPDDLEHKILMLKGRGLVRTRQDAIRCLRRYPGRPLSFIIASESRPRKFQNRFGRAWRRFWRRW